MRTRVWKALAKGVVLESVRRKDLWVVGILGGLIVCAAGAMLFTGLLAIFLTAALNVSSAPALGLTLETKLIMASTFGFFLHSFFSCCVFFDRC